MGGIVYTLRSIFSRHERKNDVGEIKSEVEPKANGHLSGTLSTPPPPPPAVCKNRTGSRSSTILAHLNLFGIKLRKLKSEKPGSLASSQKKVEEHLEPHVEQPYSHHTLSLEIETLYADSPGIGDQIEDSFRTIEKKYLGSESEISHTKEREEQERLPLPALVEGHLNKLNVQDTLLSAQIKPPSTLKAEPLPLTSPTSVYTTQISQLPPTKMSSSPETVLRQTLAQLTQNTPSPSETQKLLKTAKHALLSLNALLPTTQTPPQHLALARSTLEAGALLSIRAQDADGFTRYWQQLQAFYELPASAYPRDASKDTAGGSMASGQKNKITGLYLMLLLTKGDYAAFHTVLEGLEMESSLRDSSSGAAGSSSGLGVLEGDKFLQYPVMLEQWLMEGAYDRVWAATKREGVPSEEFGVFSEVCLLSVIYCLAPPFYSWVSSLFAG
jgi:hypothetical protein